MHFDIPSLGFTKNVKIKYDLKPLFLRGRK
jgi:hypothetical protein